MKRAVLTTTIAALLLSTVAGVAMAREGHGRMGEGPRGPKIEFSELDMNGDGKVTAEEMTAHAKARFDAADADGNGLLSTEEMQAQAEARMQERMAERSARVMERMLDRHDDNDDGQISFEEMSDGRDPTRLIDRLDADDDGAVSEEEFAKLSERHGKRMKRGDHGRGHGKRMGDQ